MPGAWARDTRILLTGKRHARDRDRRINQGESSASSTSRSTKSRLARRGHAGIARNKELVAMVGRAAERRERRAASLHTALEAEYPEDLERDAHGPADPRCVRGFPWTEAALLGLVGFHCEPGDSLTAAGVRDGVPPHVDATGRAVRAPPGGQRGPTGCSSRWSGSRAPAFHHDCASSWQGW